MVEYKSIFDASWFKETFKGISPIKICDPDESMLKQLKYAYTSYDIRISAKLDGQAWQFFFNHTMRTRSDVPANPPTPIIGGFSIIGKNCTIFWNPLSEHERNGPRFNYIVRELTNNTYSERQETDKWQMDFRCKNDCKNISFEIISKNMKGMSRHSMHFTVPSELDSPPSKIIQKRINGRTYELTWNVHSPHEAANYTIMWIEDINITKKINHTIVTNQTKYVVQTGSYDSNIKMAVSVNSMTSTSGLFWAEGIFSNFSAVGRTMNSISIEWKLNQQFNDSKTAKIDHFVICYRWLNEAHLNLSNTCNKPVNNTENSFELTNLIPCSTYKIHIQIVSSSSSINGLLSDTVQTNTLAEKDLPQPIILEIVNITSTSAVMVFQVPIYINISKINFYIYLNNETKRAANILLDESNELHLAHHIEDLNSFATYNLSVEYCVPFQQCTKSNISIFKTLNGIPGPIEEDSFHVNLNEGKIEWTPPAHPAGLIDYYELKFQYNEDETVVLVPDTTCTLISIGSICEFMNLKISVRAVNVLNISTKESKQLAQTEEKCRKNDFCKEEFRNIFLSNQKAQSAVLWTEVSIHPKDLQICNNDMTIVFIFVLLVLCGTLTVYAIQKIQTKCDLMKDISIILPYFLGDIDKSKSNENIKLEQLKSSGNTISTDVSSIIFGF